MPKFSAFSKRKSNADETENADVTPPASSFRVLERHEVPPVPGAARMAKGSAAPLASSKPDSDEDDDNLFSDMKPHNRGSGLSNTTHATYTDNSSRHSNASTAPSSADCKNTHDESRLGSSSKPNSPEATAKGASSGRSIGSKLLNRAGRTFSFGQKKNSSGHSKDEPTPDMPPLLNHNMMSQERARGNQGNLQAEQIDLGSDFGSMMPNFDKRASMATVKADDLSSPRMLTAGRPVQPGKRVPPSPDTPNPNDPLLSPWGTPKDGGDQSRPDSPLFDLPPPVPPHQKSSATQAQARARRGRTAEDPEQEARNQILNDEDDDDEDDGELFEGRPSQFAQALNRAAAPQAPAPPEKVMTSTEFERYAKKVREAGEDDSEDEINYDDDEDEVEKSKEIARMRRKQEATMTVYRQQMMKVTGTPASEMPPQPGRPGLPASISAPQLSQMKGQQQPLPTGGSEGDEDEEIPLAILQAHGFPNRNRPPTRLNNIASNPNIRASMVSTAMARPVSMVGDPGASRRHSTLPAFARNLPQDPYYGAGIARPAVRESMLFNEYSHGPHMQKPPSPLPVGGRPVAGLIGIIDREEKAKALRRGSPSVDATRFMNQGGYLGVHNAGMDPMGGIQQHMMYNHPLLGGSGMQGMMPPHMQQQQQQHQYHQQQQQQQFQQQQQGMPMGDPAQFQMNQQRLSQYMQMQSPQYAGAGYPAQGSNAPPQQFHRMAGMAGSSSMMNLATPRGNFEGGAAADARRADYNMRTMSMVQTSSAPMVHPGYAGSVRSSMHGYAPSVAPSERSNIGLPNRYRPVSQAVGAGGPSRPGDKGKSPMRVVNKPPSIDDDDDEQGWEAMKAQREKRMSMWKSKKSVGPVN